MARKLLSKPTAIFEVLLVSCNYRSKCRLSSEGTILPQMKRTALELCQKGFSSALSSQE